jgi:hypothetical protein
MGARRISIGEQTDIWPRENNDPLQRTSIYVRLRYSTICWANKK